LHSLRFKKNGAG
jgi:hypothetical protein